MADANKNKITKGQDRHPAVTPSAAQNTTPEDTALDAQIDTTREKVSALIIAPTVPTPRRASQQNIAAAAQAAAPHDNAHVEHKTPPPRHEAQDAVDIYAVAGPYRAEMLGKDITDALQSMEKGETPITDIGKEIAKLKQKDPTGYAHLKNSDLKDLLRTSCFEAILYGQRETMYDDMNRQKITIYKGNDIGEGGIGVVAHVAYATAGETRLKFGAIKRPHPDVDFREEVQGAMTISDWNHPNIVKPLFISREQVIYETGEHTEDLRKPLKNAESADPTEYFAMLLDVGKGLQEYRRRKLFHGDIKESNVLRMQTGHDQHGNKTFKTVIIDNTPMDYKMSIRTRQATPGYHFTENEIVDTANAFFRKGYSNEQVEQHFGRATDVRAYGEMIENAIIEKMPEILEDPAMTELIARLKDPIRAGEPEMLQKAMDAVQSIITKTTKPVFLPLMPLQ